MEAIVQERFAPIASVRTRWLEWGCGQTLVAVHGLPTSADLFAPLAPMLRDVRVVAPDLIGHGGTEAPASGRLGHAAYARHLGACLDALAPNRCSLLLHDLGGVLGLGWAAAHAERVRSIVVLSTTLTRSARLSAIYAANAVLGSGVLRRSLPWTLKTATLAPELARRWAAPWTRRRILRGWDHFAARHLARIRRALAGFDRPVLLVWGEEDDVFPVARAEAIRRVLPAARLVTLPRCGHWATLDAPASVAEHVRRFATAVPC